MSPAKLISLLIAGLLLLAGLLRYVFKQRPLTYLSILRYPLLLALVLNLLALLSASTSYSYLLRNLFELEQAGEIFLVVLLATLTGLAVAYTTVLLARAIPEFFHLRGIRLRTRVHAYVRQHPQNRDSSNFQVRAERLYTWLIAIIIGVAGLLVALLTMRAVLKESVLVPPSSAYGAAAGAVFTAGLLALGCWRVAEWLQRRLLRHKPPTWVSQPLTKVLGANPIWHLTALTLSVVTLFVYIGIAWVEPTTTRQAPALTYLLLLFMIFAWALPALSFFLDRAHIPVLAVLLLVSFLAWSWAGTDYFYEVTRNEELAADQVAQPLTAERAFAAWLSHKPVQEYPVLVLVTTNGGGIRAALWTATVLRQLQHELGRKFSESIALISSVSGGSVGTMYFVDAFDNGAPDDAALDAVVAAAQQPSLSHIAYGIAYSDVPRLFGGSLAVSRYDNDRGWKLEQAWSNYLVSRQRPHGQLSPEPTLNSWRPDILNGMRPLVIFNASVLESGERFLITPLDSRQPDCALSPHNRRWEKKYLYFNDCYPGHDLRISTAARLSASFPYITPNSRPIAAGVPITPGYHLADGGYVDNNGLLSAIDWLDAVKDVLTKEAGCARDTDTGRYTLCPAVTRQAQELALTPRKLLMVHIRSAAGFTRPAADQSFGWLYSLAGPPLTLLSSWNTQQISADDVNVKLFNNVLPPEFTVKQVFFSYCAAGSLSWQLSREEARQIEAGFGTYQPACLYDNNQQLEEAKVFFQQE